MLHKTSNLKLSWRFILIITITVTLVLSLFAVLNIHRSTRDLHHQLVKSATDIGHFVALTSHEALLSYDCLSLNDLMKEISLRENVVYALILRKERPLTTQLNRQNLIIQSITSQYDEQVKIAKILPQLRQLEKIEVLTFPIQTDGIIIANLEMGVSLRKLQQLTYEIIFSRLLEMLVLLIVLAFLISIEFHQYVIQPLHAVLKGIQGNLLNQPLVPVQVIRSDELGQVALAFNKMMQDINTSQHLLKDGEKRYRSIFNATSDALVIQDASNGKILDVNSRMLELFDLDHQTALTKTVADLSSPLQDYDEHFLLQQFENAKLGQQVIFEWLVKDNNEQSFPVEVSLSYAELDKQPRIIASVRDITLRKQVEKEIEKTKQKYFHQEKIAALGQMVAGVLHEIGNPISAISGTMEQLYETNKNEQSTSNCQELRKENCYYLEIIKSHTDRLEGITQEVANFVSPQACESEFFDLNSMIERSRGLLRYEKRLKYIDIEYNLNKAISATSGIQEHMVQVFLNLMINASAACNSQQKHQAKIIVTTEMEDDYVIFSVTDNGTGMSEEVQHNALTPFFTTKKAGVGTGLGLSLCKSLVEEQDGELEIISLEEIGTEVRVHLPALSELV